MVFLNEHKVVPARYESEGTAKYLWYLDNGASNHMTGDEYVFSSLDKNVGGKVRFRDNSCVVIEGRGSVVLECKNKEQMLLTDVYYIPHLKSNILSLGQATKGGCEVRMKDEFLWMLGHMNFEALKSMTRKQFVTGVPVVDHPTQVCEACLAGKHSRKPFPVATQYRAEQPLQLVSIDLCGPIMPTTQADNKYFMLIVDNCTRFMWVYMLKGKDQAFDVFKQFKEKIENEIGLKIKTLRSNHGGEFTSQEFNIYCGREGITMQLTAPYSPQQNGMVKRRNRSVLNMTRSILKAMSIPQDFWAEGVRHSVYILNRISTKSLNEDTPYEALKGKKPNLAHLRVFGCVGHVKVTKPWLKKLDDRSVPMVYLGAKIGTKGHRMYDVTKRRIVVSRDVHFEKGRKWDWSEYLGEVKTESSNWVEFYVHNDQFQGNVEVEEQNSIEEGSSSQHENLNFPNPDVISSQNEGQIDSSSQQIEVKYGADRQEEEDEIELLLTQEGEPMTYQEAIKEKEWKLAMDEEIQAIEEIKPGLVAKGYVQQLGIDFEEAFAPVARIETIRQAPRAWNLRLDEVLKELGFKRCQREQAVYIKTKGKSHMILGVYVDDLLITGNDSQEIEEFKRQMKQKFEMTDLGLLCYYLGIEVVQTDKGILLKQAAYARKLVQMAGLEECNETKIPMEPGLNLYRVEEGSGVDPTEYRRLVGSLRYVKGTLHYGLNYKRIEGGGLVGYSDRNHLTDTDDGRSTSGNVFYFNGSLISWQSQKQQKVALSSCEAEFMAATLAACQAIWLHGLLEEITGSKQKIVILFVDNKSAIALMKNPVFHGRSNHINTRYHYIRECIEGNQILVDFVCGELQCADVLTKAFPRIRFCEMRFLLGVEDLNK
ncbi:hypothetical protein L1987_61855 [Smallanthus sonchifolius]|uniref:Uncharacterized protein n=1 Tax=Smallanthus sonchifolius TaxID=185202 RepID=A0ACB9C8R5_9ASTR|nr:hypothetical protein L1987_61855 [Smallanthus sonchifolius]